MSNQCPCTGFEIGQSHTKLPSFLSQVLLSIQMMQVNPIFKRGVGLKDVARFMKSYFKLNGDVVSQVETSLLQGVEHGFLYKTNNKYLIVGALARVQLARGKSRKNLALESLEVFLHHSNAPRAASRKKSRSRSRSRASSHAPSSCGSVMNMLGQLERFLGTEKSRCDCVTKSKSGSRKRRRKHTRSRSKSRSRSKRMSKRKGTCSRSKSRSKGRPKMDEDTELKQTQYTVNNAALLKNTSSATNVGPCSGQTGNVNEVVGKVVDKVAKRSASRGNQRKESRCKRRRSKSHRSSKKRPVRSCRLKKR